MTAEVHGLIDINTAYVYGTECSLTTKRSLFDLPLSVMPAKKQFTKGWSAKFPL